MLFLRLLGKFRDQIYKLDLAGQFWCDDRILDYWLLLHGSIRHHCICQGNHEVLDLLFLRNTLAVWHVVTAKHRKTRGYVFLIVIWVWLRISSYNNYQASHNKSYRVLSLSRRPFWCSWLILAGIELYSYANVFYFGWKTCSIITWVKTLYSDYSFCTLHFKRLRP